MEMTSRGRDFVTARGWEDLSEILTLYEEDGGDNLAHGILGHTDFFSAIGFLRYIRATPESPARKISRRF